MYGFGIIRALHSILQTGTQHNQMVEDMNNVLWYGTLTCGKIILALTCLTSSVKGNKNVSIMRTSSQLLILLYSAVYTCTLIIDDLFFYCDKLLCATLFQFQDAAIDIKMRIHVYSTKNNVLWYGTLNCGRIILALTCLTLFVKGNKNKNYNG